MHFLNYETWSTGFTRLPKRSNSSERLRIAEAPCRTQLPGTGIYRTMYRQYPKGFWNVISFYLLYHTLGWLLTSKGHADKVHALNHQTIWTSCFPGDAPVKNLPANAGDTRDTDVIPGSGRSPGEGNDNQLQYSCLENSTDRRAWWAAVHRVKKSWTRLKWLSTAQHLYSIRQWIISH